MATTSDKTLTIRLQAVTSQLTSGLRGATSDVKKFGDDTKDTLSQVESSTERISRLWRSAFEAFLGFEAAKALRDLALGAAEAADQLAIAARTAQNFHHNLDPTAMEAWLESFSKSAAGGGYAINDMRAAVQEFSTLGLDAAQTQRAIADTANLAAARNISFGESMTIVRQALTGHVEMLTRYGIISREAAKGITTVEQAMEALEHATSGAAAERSNTLIGAFGRLTSSLQLLRDTIGQGLIPFFNDFANVATHVSDAIGNIPKPILNAVTGFVALAVGAGAVALVLPAIAKGFTILLEGVRLVGALTGLTRILTVARTAMLALADANFVAAASYLAAAAVPALVAAAIAALIVLIVEITLHTRDFGRLWSDVWQLAVDKWHAFVSDVASTFAPVVSMFSSLFSAIAQQWKSFVGVLHDLWARFVTSFEQLTKAVMNALGVFTSSLRPVADAWDQFCDYLDKRFGGFVDKLGEHVKTALSYLQAMSVGGAIAGPLGAIIAIPAGARDKKTNADERRVGGDLGKIGGDVLSDWRKLVTSIKDAFKPTSGKTPAIPKEAFTGDIPGSKGKDGGPAAAENALKNFEETMKSVLERFADRVTDVRHQAEKSTTAVDLYKAGLPGGAPQNEQQALELQKLISAQIRDQQTLHDRLLEQQHAELAAQASLEQYAAKISTHLKNHDQLVREAKDAAREHLHTAQQLGEEYLKIGVTVAKLKGDIRSALQTGIDNSVNAQIDALETALANKKIGYDEQSEGVSSQLDKMRVTKGSNPVEEDRLKIELAQLALAAAEDTKAEKEHAAALLQDEYNRTQSHDALQRLTDAQNQLAQSTLEVAKAQDAYNLAQDQLIVDQKQKWDTFIDGLVSKAGMPGLSAQNGMISFNPLTLLLDAISKTQAFADIINTATQIVNTLAQAFEALRPVIDAVMMIVRAVVNVFIFLYNAVARILDLFGLQIQQLQYLTDAMSGLVPLISIVHEIPTLNELAAGRLNSPLSTTPQGSNTLGQSNGGQNGLMRVIEILTGILMAVIVEKMISGMTFGQALHQTGELVGLNIGQKMQTPLLSTNNALTTLTNGLITTSNATLVAILAALQAQAATSWIQKIGGAVSGGLTPFARGGGAGGASGGPIGPDSSGLSNATKAISSALSSVTRALRSHAAAIRDSISALQDFTNAANSASRALIAVGAGTGLSQSLGLDTDRRMNMSGKNIDRVNIG